MTAAAQQQRIERGTPVYLNGDEAITGTVVGFGDLTDEAGIVGCYIVKLDEGAWHGDYTPSAGVQPGTMFVSTVVATAGNIAIGAAR